MLGWLWLVLARRGSQFLRSLDACDSAGRRDAFRNASLPFPFGYIREAFLTNETRDVCLRPVGCGQNKFECGVLAGAMCVCVCVDFARRSDKSKQAWVGQEQALAEWASRLKRPFQAQILDMLAHWAVGPARRSQLTHQLKVGLSENLHRSPKSGCSSVVPN